MEETRQRGMSYMTESLINMGFIGGFAIGISIGVVSLWSYSVRWVGIVTKVAENGYVMEVRGKFYTISKVGEKVDISKK